jgi:hypothetical protein
MDVNVSNVLKDVKINNSVYNGVRKVDSLNENFVDEQSVRQFILYLNEKILRALTKL